MADNTADLIIRRVSRQFQVEQSSPKTTAYNDDRLFLDSIRIRTRSQQPRPSGKGKGKWTSAAGCGFGGWMYITSNTDASLKCPINNNRDLSIPSRIQNKGDSMTQAHETSAIELQNLHRQRPEVPASHVSTTEESTTASSLPAADGGLAAWRLLIAAFVFEALLWGQSSTSLCYLS